MISNKHHHFQKGHAHVFPDAVGPTIAITLSFFVIIQEYQNQTIYMFSMPQNHHRNKDDR